MLYLYLNYSYHGKLLISNYKWLLQKVFLRRFSDTISQFLDNEIIKSGVFRLNTIRFIKLSDVDMSICNISIHDYT